MNTQTENITCVYNDKCILVAIIKRDEITGKKVIYIANEASIEEIEELISPDKTVI